MDNKEIMEDVIMEELEEDQEDVINYTFAKPVEFEGENYKKIIMDLEGLTGKDIKDVSKELLAQGEVLGFTETNKSFLAAIAAKSANLPYEFMDYVPGKDLCKITIQVQNFLLE